MLKLVYHTAVFGPIDLEYDRPVIRVGRNPDNDLVLPHPSIEPYHCVFVFRGEKLLCMPPDASVSDHTDLRRLRGPEFCAGDQLQIGDLQFSLAHSPKTVAIPTFTPPDAATPIDSSGASFYCSYCRMPISETEVKRVGLVGRPKRSFCPKCSRPVEIRAGDVNGVARSS